MYFYNLMLPLEAVCCNFGLDIIIKSDLPLLKQLDQAFAFNFALHYDGKDGKVTKFSVLFLAIWKIHLTSFK